jgi:hypothetical protein
MAVVSLNKFRTIRVGITTEMVGIYTCPIGVASIITLALVTNVSTGSTVHSVTAVHSRVNPENLSEQSDYRISYEALVPPNDSLNLVSDGRLVLETNDIIKIQGDENGELELILSVLENAKQ